MSDLLPEDARALDVYLQNLRVALGSVGTRERDDILLVTRTRVQEQLDLYPGRSIAQVLSELGAPSECARRFIVYKAPDAAGSKRGRFAKLRSLGWKGLLLAPVMIVGYTIVLVMLAIATTKMFQPASTGLWVYYVDGVRHYAGGINTDGHTGTEVLGYWVVFGPLAIATLLHLGLAALYRLVTRSKKA